MVGKLIDLFQENFRIRGQKLLLIDLVDHSVFTNRNRQSGHNKYIGCIFGYGLFQDCLNVHLILIPPQFISLFSHAAS